MKSHLLAGLGFGLIGASAVIAQGQPQTPPAPAPAHLRATADPGYAAVIAKCKTPPPARGGGAAGGARAGGGAAPGAAAGAPQGAAGQGRAAGAATPAGPADYTVTEIPGVIAAGARWTLVFQTTGNNADGPVASEDGGLMIAQHDNGAVVKIDPDGKATTVYRDTNTGGSLAMNTKGALFVAERGLHQAIRQLAPQRRILADTYMGDPLECFGGLNDVTADGKGGVYFTMGGLFYADAKGVVTQYGENLQTNGVILSPDEKTLYVTNRQTVAAFDVRPDGSLTNQREFGKLPSGGGDGSAVDAAGRLYVTGGPAVHVFAPDGKYLGNIPAPKNLITTAFAGRDKKTLYAIANDQRVAEVYAIPMIAQGYRGRAK
jgi:gluconolactonase